MKPHHLLYPLAIIVFVLALGAASSSRVDAQAGCPTTGTLGKDVGRDFFVQVVSMLKDVPQNDFAVEALFAWKPYEGTNALWNPLATTWQLSPVCNFNTKGVQNYVSQTSGAQATANTLNLSYYDSIRSMLRKQAFDLEAIRASLGTWGTCSGATCDSLLNTWQGLYSGSNITPTTGSTTVMIFDTSGSMDDQDASGVSKLDASRQAGMELLDVIGAENRAGISSGNRVGAVQYGNTASIQVALTTDTDAAKSALAGLFASGATAMPKGLRTALDMLPSGTSQHTYIILLTDGLVNVGLNDEQDEATARQQVLDLASEAGRRSICVYTVGFGDPASLTIDESFLTDVAAKSGCGSYHNARDAWQLANVYINLRHASTGNTLLSNSGTIAQGQVVNIGSVQVPDNQAVILFTLNWPGSQLNAILKDPKGQLVDQTYPGASVSQTGTLDSIIIQNPYAGPWTVSAQGVSVPEGTTNYNAVFSVRPNPNPPAPPAVVNPPITRPSSGGGAPAAIILVVVAVVGVLTYTLVHNAQRTGPRAVGAHAIPGALAAMNGSFAGRSIPLRDGLVIGRGSTCALRLEDPSVSRRHAQIRYANGRWFIQDLKSQLGVFVNGARVNAVALNRGDRVRIGSIEFVFN